MGVADPACLSLRKPAVDCWHQDFSGTHEDAYVLGIQLEMFPGYIFSLPKSEEKMNERNQFLTPGMERPKITSLATPISPPTRVS